MRPDLYESAVDGSLTIESVDKFFGINKSMIDRSHNSENSYNHAAYIVSGVWSFILTSGAYPETDKGHFSSLFSNFGDYPKTIIADIDRDFFGLFEVSE
jgi:hypothetical protein